MKKFYLRVALLVVLVVFTTGIYYIVQYFLAGDEKTFGPELYYAIDLAQENTEYTDVIIGDSVARLIFAPDYQSETDTTCYLATNQAITVLGNYILLNRYLENNPQTEEVTYIVRPQSLANPLWFNYSFQYFLVPFYNAEYKQYIDTDTQKYIEDRFGKVYATSDIVKNFIEKNSYYLDVYLNNILEQQLEVRDEKHISELSVKYLKKMKELCDEKNVGFRVVCSPLPDTAENHDWDDFMSQIKEYGLSDILGDYFDGLDFYPEEDFCDEAHFTDGFLAQNREKIIEKLMHR